MSPGDGLTRYLEDSLIQQRFLLKDFSKVFSHNVVF